MQAAVCEEQGDFWLCLTSGLDPRVWAGGGCWGSRAESGREKMEGGSEACWGLPMKQSLTAKPGPPRTAPLTRLFPPTTMLQLPCPPPVWPCR